MKYFRETTESVFRLDFHYEWIIFDNFSNDGTRPYIKQIAQRRDNIRYFFNNRNLGGPSPNYKIGVQKALGNYLLFLDSDDTLPSSMALKKGLNLLEGNQEVHVAISKVAYMDENGTVYKIKKIPFVQYNRVISGRILFWTIFLWPTYPLKQGAVLFRKELLGKNRKIY